MKERPILFSAPMVRALLAGTKTQTRREVKFPVRVPGYEIQLGEGKNGPPDFCCPYGVAGDRLWVKETWGFRGLSWCSEAPSIETIHIKYAADQITASIEKPDGFSKSPACKLPKQRDQLADETEWERREYLTRYWRQWRPSIYMQRWMSRITLEIVSVRVERLNEISEADATAEGVIGCARQNSYPRGCEGLPQRAEYAILWESINGAGSWDASPWVWVIEFKRVEASS